MREKKPIISGIYCIENLINKKRYVGQSRDIYDRWSGHNTELNYNKHDNEHLQNAWNKYGKDNFIFYILEECEHTLLNERENYYGLSMKVLNRKYGYNKDLPCTVAASLERYRAKAISTMKRKAREHIRKENTILMINLETLEVKEYQSPTELAVKLDLTYSRICEALSYWRGKGRRKQYKSHLFISKKDYKDDFDYINFKKEYPKVRKLRISEEEKERRALEKANHVRRPRKDCVTNKKPVILVNKKTLEEIEVESVAEACRQYNLTKTIVAIVLKRNFKERSHKGFFIRYK